MKKRLPVIVAVFLLLFASLLQTSFARGSGSAIEGQGDRGVLIASAPVAAEEVEDYGELDLEALLSQEISLASLKKESVREAPSIVTVYSREEIEAMGIKTLLELFDTIPGFHLSRDNVGVIKTRLHVRGVESGRGVKIYLDGHSLNSLYTGAYDNMFRTLPLDNVERIEVIRGPGSALYGSNAFTGVINIITREEQDLSGFEGRIWGGSFNTVGGSATYGGRLGPFKMVLSAIASDTDGHRRMVEEDVIGRSAPTDTKRAYADLGMKLHYNHSRLILHYKRERFGGMWGVTNITTPTNNRLADVFFADYLYERQASERVKFSFNAYFDHRRQDNLWEGYPIGEVVDHPVAGPLYYQLGGLAHAVAKEVSVGSEARLTVGLFEGNELTAGMLYEYSEQFGITYSGTAHPVTFLPIDTWKNYTDTYNWIEAAGRHVFALYAQDAWKPVEKLNIVAGVRWDRYSDFGGTVNPRIGATVSATEEIGLKILYGSAFRAPAFDELYIENQPILKGNPNLDAEKLYTLEAGIDYRAKDLGNFSANYYASFLRDGIVRGAKPSEFEPEPHVNQGGLNIQGFDLELKAGYKNLFYVYGHYSYAHSEDKDTGQRTPRLPRHKGLFGVNLTPRRSINFNARVTVIGGRSRDRIDARPAADPVALLDATLWLRDVLPRTDFKTSIRNASNEDYRYLSSKGKTIPGDYPAAGRSFLAELIFRY